MEADEDYGPAVAVSGWKMHCCIGKRNSILVASHNFHNATNREGPCVPPHRGPVLTTRTLLPPLTKQWCRRPTFHAMTVTWPTIPQKRHPRNNASCTNVKLSFILHSSSWESSKFALFCSQPRDLSPWRETLWYARKWNCLGEMGWDGRGGETSGGEGWNEQRGERMMHWHPCMREWFPHSR